MSHKASGPKPESRKEARAGVYGVYKAPGRVYGV